MLCRSLGFETGEVSSISNYGPGRGPIWLDDLQCEGAESSIFGCKHPGFGIHDCNHSEDSAVVCGKYSTGVFNLAEMSEVGVV